MHGGDGDDSIYSVSQSALLSGDAGNDRITVQAHYNTVDGGSGDDTISVLGYSYETIAGGAGNDSIIAGAGGYHSISGGAGDDTIDAASGDNNGGQNNYGATGHQTIDGGAGNDVFENVAYWNNGGDLLTGGGGQNTYVLNAVEPCCSAAQNVVTPHADTVTDFSAGSGGDKIDLSLILAALHTGYGYTSGHNPFSDGYLRVQDDGSGNALLQINLYPATTGWSTVLGQSASIDWASPFTGTSGANRGALRPAGPAVASLIPP